MTFYAGEILQLTLGDVTGRPTLAATSLTESGVVWRGKAQDADTLTAPLVSGVRLSIVDSLGGVVVSTSMAWDSARSLWWFDWNTAILPVGTYTAKVVIGGTSGVLSWEFGVIRLRAGKFDRSTLDGGSAAPLGETIDGGTSILVAAGVLDGGGA